MAESTGPVLAIGAITLTNRVLLNDQAMDWRIPIGTVVAALLFSGLEKAVGRPAVYLAYLALVTVTLTRVDPTVPAPAESARKWFDER